MKHPKQLIELIKWADFVYICGNGGSASTANHFANDLVKMCGVGAVSLCANEAIVMAYANDDGYENIFVKQLEVFLTINDLLITISGSGTSPNIVKAKKYARQLLCPVWSFPTMKESNRNMLEVEDYHLQIAHAVTTVLSK
jgi:D-sedoheptulose 7-phosphate isomerase|tara:strand:+ start:1121 stop:1543 length:423 start_codon:yes stop_codon:yes gene_type:complete